MKRIAIVGLGQRGMKFLEGLAEHRNDTELAAVCDASVAMLEAKKPNLNALGLDPSFHPAAKFAEMVESVKPDTVLVLTPDHTHVDYACAAMELGRDVIVEKPLTTNFENCQRIIDVQKQTGRSCVVTLNYRYNPAHRHIKDLLMKGTIGDIQQVVWAAGTGLAHGARFFRRWHSEKSLSGSLLVHKCCHLFDLVAFWLGSRSPWLVGIQMVRFPNRHSQI